MVKSQYDVREIHMTALMIIMKSKYVFQEFNTKLRLYNCRETGKVKKPLSVLLL